MSEEKQQTKTESDKNKTGSAGIENEGLKLLGKAAETIAGNNKIMGNVLKFVLSPLGLIALLCGMGYLLWKNKTHKDRIVALEKELLEAKYEIKDLEKEVTALEKIRKPKQIAEYEQEHEETHGIDYVPMRHSSKGNKRPERNKNIHLD